jgi:hypothetical protein
MPEDSLSNKPFDRASELLTKFAQRETVAKAPVVATQHEVTPAPVIQAFEPRPLTIGLGMEKKADGLGFGSTSQVKEVLIINPTWTVTATAIHEITETVTWPDGTPVTVDMGDQPADLGYVGYSVRSGVLYLRWISFDGSGGSLDFSGEDITITAFLKP